MSVPNDDILEHLIPFQETGFNTSEAEYAHKTAQCLKELIALRAELEELREINKRARHIISSWSEGSGDIELKRELHALRFKTSELERFVWWVHSVYSKNVMDTVTAITHACTYRDEATAASGKYGLPIKCFEMMHWLTEYTHRIYDGTYLDAEISTGVKTSTDNNKGE